MTDRQKPGQTPSGSEHKSISEETTERLRPHAAVRPKRSPLPKETIARMSEAHRGKKHSEETKRKISESEKGKIVSEETRRKMRESKLGRERPGMRGANHPRARRINQLTLDGRLVRTWDCLKDISDDPRFPSACFVRECCKGNKNAYKGFRWEYTDAQSQQE